MNVGDRVEDFELLDQSGSPRRLSEFLSKGRVVLFFYPGAMTRGCTAESCHFRDLGAEFEQLNAQRVGISPDPVDKQARFAELNSFDYPLLSDPNGEIARRFNVRRPFGPLKTRRWTFVIDVDSSVLAVIKSETNMAEHADAALAALRAAA
jgi:thioredoxin-dependent peroxiredoxin